MTFRQLHMFTPISDYCNVLFTCLNSHSIAWLQNVLNFKTVLITYKALYGLVSEYIVELLRPYCIARPLRSSDQGLLAVLKSRFKPRVD